MNSHIVQGYVFGVLWGIGYGLFRFHYDGPWYEHIAITLIGSFTVAGAIGAAAGFLVAFCQAVRRRVKNGRSQVL